MNKKMNNNSMEHVQKQLYTLVLIQEWGVARSEVFLKISPSCFELII